MKFSFIINALVQFNTSFSLRKSTHLQLHGTSIRHKVCVCRTSVCTMGNRNILMQQDVHMRMKLYNYAGRKQFIINTKHIPRVNSLGVLCIILNLNPFVIKNFAFCVHRYASHQDCYFVSKLKRKDLPYVNESVKTPIFVFIWGCPTLYVIFVIVTSGVQLILTFTRRQ